MLRILALEPYYTGSHRAFLDGWVGHSRHCVERLTMPGRKWKWRMRGSALTLGEQVRRRAGDFDLLFASDFLDMAALVGMHPDALGDVPRVVYFHENQITYPVADEGERDYQFGFTNLTTCLAADSALFNSQYHLESFLRGADDLLRRMPDCVPRWAPERIRRSSRVVPVGVDLASIDAACPAVRPRRGALTIVWNHRWEWDKRVEAFFGLLYELLGQGCDFAVIAAGRDSGRSPAVQREARRRLGDRLLHMGFVPSRRQYCRLLCRGDVVVSTAVHEFFGVSIVEAAYAGCLPLLPDDLSYPELVPAQHHEQCLYRDLGDLKDRLADLCERPQAARAVDLRAAMRRFNWDRVGPLLDDAVEEVAGERRNG